MDRQGNVKHRQGNLKVNSLDDEPPGNNRQGWLDRDNAISLTVYR